MYRRSARGRVLLLVLLALSIVLITVDFRSGGGGPLADAKNISSAVVAPIQRGITAVTRPIGNLFSSIGDLAGLRSQNDQLEGEVQQLQQDTQNYGTVVKDNARLRQMLGLQKSWLSMKTVTAQVIGVAPDNYKWAVFVDRGRADGIHRDMAVVAPEGLVGKIVNVGPHQSTVLLLIDPQAAAAAKIPGHLVKSSVTPKPAASATPTPSPSVSAPVTAVTTPTPTVTSPAPKVTQKRFTKTVSGLVQGNGGSQDLSMVGVGGNEKVHTGAKVVTDFYNGGIFPPGIPVGTVSSVVGDKRTLEQGIKLQPYVDFSNLDYVEILLETGRHPPYHGGK